MKLRLAALAALLLAGCATKPTPEAAPADKPPAATTARAAGVSAGATVTGLDARAATRALAAFRISCPSLVKREDGSGLTRPADWSPACEAAAAWPDADAARFFAEQFEPVRVGDGVAFATGYFEPEIGGARTKQTPGAVPVYRRPPDLIDVELGRFSESLKGKTVRGRVGEEGKLVPYHDRTAIEEGALAGRDLELAWADDPIELFFLQIQGSGRLRARNGSVIRIGYDGQNGRDYTAVGRVLRERGELQSGEATMDGIIGWMRRQPDRGRALMRENRSYVFFRALTGPGPLGALGLPVTPRATVAADPAFVPLGAPVVLALDRAEANGLWIAQDTGGAIKGANRFDTFWGAGDEAKTIAGGMSAKGSAVLLLPRGALARLNGAGDAAAER